MNNKKVYVVIQSDWFCPYKIHGVSTNKSIVEKCREYELKCGNVEHENLIKIVEVDFLDEVDFEAKFRELAEKELQKKLAEQEAIKQADLAEFKRIKEKYNL